jgi:uncharacterized membrane protein
LISLAFLTALPRPATASLRFCNKTQNKVFVAIVYAEDYLFDINAHVEGWWSIEPGACATAISDPLSDGKLYYYYAEDEGSGKWSGDIMYCVSKRKFAFHGDQADSCSESEMRGFRSLNIGNSTNYTMDLTDN